MKRLNGHVTSLGLACARLLVSFVASQTNSDDVTGVYPPIVGIHNFQPICANNTAALDTEVQRGCEVRQRLIAAMETDELLQGKRVAQER